MALFKRKAPMLGVDISPSSVKVVELSRSGSRFRIEGFAIEPLGEGVMEDRNPADPEAVGEAIKRACRTAGIRTRHAAVAVPTSSVINRTIPMPAEFKESDIEDNISVEASQYIPYPIEEIHLDFQMKGASLASADQQDVLLVATRKENVDTREAALKEAKLIPVVVDVEAYALENTFRLIQDSLSHASDTSETTEGMSLSKTSERLTAVVDIGATITSLYIFQADQIIFSREQGFGCDLLTLRIAETYGLSREQAERAKRNREVADDYDQVLLDPFKQALAEQVGHALQFFFSSDHFIAGRYEVDNLVLLGGGALLPGMDRVVADVLGITTTIGNPFRNMGSAGRVSRTLLLRDAPLLGIAAGLALRSFDA